MSVVSTLLLSFLVFGVLDLAPACDYSFMVEGDEYEVALEELPAVFVGRVNRVEVIAPDSLLHDGLRSALELGYHYRATFAVAHAWKGPTEYVAVDWWSNCEVAFEIGRRYVVFAERWDGASSEGVLIAPVWWKTVLLDRGHSEIEALNSAASRLRARGVFVEPWEL